ncbi:Ca2+:H+ antiporter, partial [Colletotrichum abscissum]|uniref:Ca2+:H+ antiporter n=1 Tax=Colletotrichum abscissum TaxID=1671311 RepID=UPI0027D71C5F
EGARHECQKFHAIVSEFGNGLLLVAAFGLLIPSTLYSALNHENFTEGTLQADVLRISQAISIALIVAFILHVWASGDYSYVWYQANSHSSIFDEVIEIDEQRDADRKGDMEKPKFTLTGSIIVLFISWSSRYTLPLPGSFHPCGSPQRATVVLVERALENPMDLDCRTLMIALLVLSILVVGNYLRDGEST